MFKVFGHYQHHPLHKDAKQEFQTRPPPRRMLPPSIPISQPVRSPKFGPLPCPPSSTVLAKHDVLVWFEICELAPNGEYVPSVRSVRLTFHDISGRRVSLICSLFLFRWLSTVTIFHVVDCFCCIKEFSVAFV